MRDGAGGVIRRAVPDALTILPARGYNNFGIKRGNAAIMFGWRFPLIFHARYLAEEALQVRVRSMILLLLIVVVVSAAGYYLTVINPVTDDIDLGLDLVGGIRVVYEPVDPAEATDQAMNQAVETIRFRWTSSA